MAMRLNGETNGLSLVVPPFLLDLWADGKSSVLVAVVSTGLAQFASGSCLNSNYEQTAEAACSMP
jgi:hypothetical protein